MQSIEDLIEPVVEATTAGSLRWKQEGHSTFVLKLPRHIINVWSWSDDDDGSTGITAQLRLTNAANDLLDATSASEFSPRYNKLSTLLSNARRSALDVDSVIDSIKGEIENLKKLKA